MALIAPDSLYDQLLAIPENWVGEVTSRVNFYTQPRPAGPYAVACSFLERNFIIPTAGPYAGLCAAAGYGQRGAVYRYPP
jgi:hypothetical protein